MVVVVSVPPILLQLVLPVVLNRRHWEAAHRWLVLLSRHNSGVPAEVHLDRRLQRALLVPLEVWVPETRGDLLEQVLKAHLGSLLARLVE